jgi:hypothetical protein
MPICLWEGCKLVFADAATFQEHIFTKHIQQEMQQPKMDNQNNANDDTEAEDGPSLAKHIKMGNDEDNDNMICGNGEERAKR